MAEDVIAQAAAQAWAKRAADTLSLSKATTLQPKLTTSAISNAPPPHLLPAVAPAAQQLQLPPVKQKTPGTPQPMTLGSQISRWYENAGGLDRAISGAQNAMARRPKPALDAVPATKKGKRDLLWPTWAPEDVTQRTVPVTPVNGNPSSGAAGVWSPNKDGNGPWVGVDARSSRVPATLEHELSHNAYVRNSGVLRAQERAVWDPDLDGVFERAAKAKKDSELLQIFARPSRKTWRLPERSLIPFSATGPYSDIDHQRYVLSPAEVDVRLAEIKRRYAHETGKLVETPEQAHDAWEWWRSHQSQWHRSPTHTPTIDERTFQLYDELPPDMRQQLFERMPELVRSGQAPSKHAAAAGQAWAKRAAGPQPNFSITQPQTIPAATPAKPLEKLNLPVVPGSNNADTFSRTGHAWNGWMNQNYGTLAHPFGAGRYNAHSALSAQLRSAGPQAVQRYADRMQQTVYPKALAPRTAYTFEPNPRAAAFAGRAGTNSAGQTTLSLGTKEGPIDFNDLGTKKFKNTEFLPQLTQFTHGAILAHELEHVNQGAHEDGFEANLFAQRGFSPTEEEKTTRVPVGDNRFKPLVPLGDRFAAEAPAVLSEIAHTADATRHATGRPLQGEMQLVPEAYGGGYQMPLEDIAREARRNGLISGDRTSTELLNTPAGQAWMQMQANKFNQNYPQEKQNSYCERAAAEAAGQAWAKRAAEVAPPTLAERFQPDYTPEQLESLGVYDSLYRGQGPRLASLGEWKPEWVSEHDPKGWAQWYKRYTAGRRLEGEDERQIKRWLSFKARHGGPFVANPTPRRGWALRNWGIDPAKLVEPGQSAQIQEMLDAYKNRKMQEHLQARAGEEKQSSSKLRRLLSIVPEAVSWSGAPAATKWRAMLNGREIGSLVTAPKGIKTNPAAHQILYSNLHPQFRGAGLGRKLYMDVARRTGGELLSDTKVSPAAQRLWQGLQRRNYGVTMSPAALPARHAWIDKTQKVYDLPTSPLRDLPGSVTNIWDNIRSFFRRVVTPDANALDYIYKMKLPPRIPLIKSSELLPEVQLQEHQQRIADRTTSDDPRLLVYHGLGSGKSLSALAAAEDIDFDQWHGKAFKIVTTPPGKSVKSNTDGTPIADEPGRVSIVTPENGDAWNWPAAPQETIKNFRANWGSIQSGIGGYKMDQIRRGMQLSKPISPTPSTTPPLQQAIQKAAALNPDVQLQEHQQRIADRATSDDPRLLVYHGLGSGKSLSALAAAEAAKKVYGDDYGIVAPASLRGNFQKEIKKFTTSQPEVMSYTGLGMGKQFQEQPETLVMDEAHRLRNPDAASAQAAAQAAAKAKRLLLLTGSPITNNPADLANLLSLLHNKPISPEWFEKRFVGYKKVNPGVINWLRGIKPGEQPVVQHENELRKLLAGKVDYQPSKTPEGVNVNEEVVRVPLSPEQKKIQHAIRTKIPPGFLWKLDQEFPLSRDELAKLNSFMTGLRQVSLSTQPFRSDKSPQKAFDQSAKLRQAFENLKTTLDSDPRKKAIIYSNFIDSGLRPYASALEKAQIPHAFFHGGVSPKLRQAAVDAYNAGKLRALLIGPAGAEGLSTRGTSLIQLLDPHWHESRSQQARGRGLRFDSHVGLPEELKNVAVQRYISSSEDPSWMGKLMGYQRERTGDEMLEHLTAEKEKLNDAFRKILREEGAPDREKQSAPSGRSAKAMLDAALDAVRFRGGNLATLGVTGAGAGAGWAANDAFLDKYNPDVTPLGRLRSNMRAATMGGVGGLTLRGRVPLPSKPMAIAAGFGLGARYALVTPANGRFFGLGIGQFADPGHAAIPQWLAKHEANKPAIRAVASDPETHAIEYGEKQLTDALKKNLLEPQKVPQEDGTVKETRAPAQVWAGKYLKEKTLPWLYTETLKALGSDAREKTVVDQSTGKKVTVPDVQFSDIGAALAPHLAGGAGGAYLGYRLGDTLGNFVFPDKEKDEYENRRRQEIRRWWMQFLGGNLGAIGGTMAAIKAMPHIRDVMRKAPPPETKTAAAPTTARSLLRTLGGLGVDVGLGTAWTAGQYGLNKSVPGYIPYTAYDKNPNTDAVRHGEEPEMLGRDPAKNLPFLGGLLAVNSLAMRPWRKAVAAPRTKWPVATSARQSVIRGVGRPEFRYIWPSGTFLVAGPSIVHPFTHVPSLAGTIQAAKPLDFSDPTGLPARIGELFNKPSDVAERIGKRVVEEKLMPLYNQEIAHPVAGRTPVTDAVTSAAEGVAREAGLPGFDNAGDLANFMKSVSLSTLAQGAGIATGGVGGMLAGDWLADKLLTAAQQRKWLKKRPKTHKFVRDLTALAGAGLGAYGALRGLDVKLPGMVHKGQTPPQTA